MVENKTFSAKKYKLKTFDTAQVIEYKSGKEI